MEDFKKFLSGLISAFKFLVFIFLIQIYCVWWFDFFKQKKWLPFILMSILPALILYYLVWGLLVGGAPPGGQNPYMTSQY